jgi:hypothetical protein
VSWEPLDEIPWIFLYSDGRSIHCYCQICQAQSPPTDDNGIDAFVAQHEEHRSPVPTHMGMGDMFAAATKALGFEKKCSPCEARRRAMNNAMPTVWRR